MGEVVIDCFVGGATFTGCTWEIFKPCFKHYLLDHVKSRFAQVPAPEWEIATFLPTADFEKAGKGTVYNDSRSMI